MTLSKINKFNTKNEKKNVLQTQSQNAKQITKHHETNKSLIQTKIKIQRRQKIDKCIAHKTAFIVIQKNKGKLYKNKD